MNNLDNNEINKQLEELYKEGKKLFGKDKFTLKVHLFNDNDYRVLIEHNLTSELRIWKIYGQEYILNSTPLEEIIEDLIDINKNIEND